MENELRFIRTDQSNGLTVNKPRPSSRRTQGVGKQTDPKADFGSKALKDTISLFGGANADQQSGGNSQIMKKFITLIAIGFLALGIAHVWKKNRAATKPSQDAQYIESQSSYLCYYVLKNSMQEHLPPGSLVYSGILNKAKIEEAIKDAESKAILLERFGRYWRPNSSGDFITRSGAIVFMEAKYLNQKATIYFSLYDSYDNYKNANPSYKSKTETVEY
jgi:hypothetical protein